MNNFKIKKYFLVVVALFLCSLTFSFKESNAVEAASDLPDILTVQTGNGANIASGSVAYISSSDAVTLKLAGGQNVSNISCVLYINEELYDRADYNIDAVDYKIADSTLTVTSTTKACGLFEYEISYWETSNNGIQTEKAFEYNYFVMQQGDYYLTNSPNGRNGVNAEMGIATVNTNLNSSVYDRSYFFNYNAVNGNTPALPTLSFDYTRYNLTITKTLQRKVEIQNIEISSSNLLTDNNLVYINYSQDSNNATVVFNNIGSYTISYQPKFTADNGAVYLLERINDFKHYDILEMFGYQLFYTDSATSSQKEFKNISNTGEVGTECTDLSFLVPQNHSQPLEKTDSLESVLNSIENKAYEIQSTNQTPVVFNFNTKLYTQNNFESKIYTITKNDKSYISTSSTAFTNEPITKAGIYAVELYYTYTSEVNGTFNNVTPTFVDDSNSVKETLFRQWFVFEVENSTPSASIVADSNDDGIFKDPDTNVLNNYITNKNVQISKEITKASIFNEQTILEIEYYQDFATTLTKKIIVTEDESFIAQNSGRYVVTLYSGKNLSSSSRTTFSIDKNPISNITISTLSIGSGASNYYKNGTADFITRNAVAVSWNEKSSGAITSAKYKFIPMTKNADLYASESYKTFLNKDYKIPSNYSFNFAINEEYYARNYTNASSSSVGPESALTDAGMYIFLITDSAGNEQYFSFIIDNSTTPILQKEGDAFVEVSDLNIISNNATIVMGKTKLVEFGTINYDGDSFNIKDTWIQEAFEILNNGSNSLFQKYFSQISIGGTSKYFLSCEIDNKALITVNNVMLNKDFYDLSQNQYSYEIQLKNENHEILENQYMFYTMDTAQTKTLLGYDRYTKENYLANATGQHIVTVSTDASGTNLFFFNDGSNKSLLKQEGFYNTNTEDSQKDKYYTPTTISTLKNSSETLYLQFKPIIDENVFEVASIYIEFYPFAQKQEVNSMNNNLRAYTYCFEDTATSIQVYDKNKMSTNAVLKNVDDTNYYQYLVNQAYNPLTKQLETQSGKYVITRVYDTTLSGASSKINESNDFITRTMTVIVDRNPIITAPVEVDPTNDNYLYSLIGHSIVLQVLSDDSSYFNDLYLAQNITGEVILETNKLPVYLYIPNIKYGYSFNNGEQFIHEDSINTAFDTNTFSGFALNAVIKYSSQGIAALVKPDAVYTTSYANADNNNYLSFISSKEGSAETKAFTSPGFYEVTISQGDSYYGEANTFTFIFRIINQKPSFDLLSSSNKELGYSNGNYITNSNELTISWTDPNSEFLANIDIESLILRARDSGFSYNIPLSMVETTGYTHTINLDLKNINRQNIFANNTTLEVYASYEGKETDYPAGFFSVTKTVLIDTTAPTEIINYLSKLNNVDNNNIRSVGETYNITTEDKSSLYKNFSYIFDYSNMDSLDNIFNSKTIYYRMYADNTRYKDYISQQTKVNDFLNSTKGFTTYNKSLSTEFINKYIEFIEQDLAGNISIYTVYFTDIASYPNQSAIEYSNNEIGYSINYSKLSATNNIFAKGSFEITKISAFDYAHNILKIDGLTYLTTPYLDNKYVCLELYDANNIKYYTIEDLTTFAPSSNIQTIELELMPNNSLTTLSVSVLNSYFNIQHTTSTELYKGIEGILVPVPDIIDETTALIYATSVSVSYYQLIADKYEKINLYNLTDQDNNEFLKVFGSETPINSNIDFEYIVLNSQKYLKISVKETSSILVSDTYFEYEIKDNYGDTKTITNIFNQEVVENIFISSVDLVYATQNGTDYIYSTDTTKFTYNSKKDKIKINVGTTYYDLSNNADVSNFINSNYGTIMPSPNSNLIVVTMYPAEQQLENNLFGSKRVFSIYAYRTIDDSTSSSPYESYNVAIYNSVPEIQLTNSTDGTKLNSLFSGSLIYSGDLIINFSKQENDFDTTMYLQYEDEEMFEIQSGYLVTESGRYTLIVKYNKVLVGNDYNQSFTFSIANSDQNFYQVTYTDANGNIQIAEATGSPFTYTSVQNTHTITNHFIVNTDYEIVTNEQEFVTATQDETISNNGYITKIYTITNQDNDKATKFFKTKIAITIVRSNNGSILNNFVHYTSSQTVNVVKDSMIFVVSKDEGANATKKLSWQSYYGIKENLVYPEIKILLNNDIMDYKPNITTSNTTSYLTISTSGTYYLTFRDIAGNINRIGTSNNSTYTIVYLNNVIFEVNNQTPIQNAFYDTDVTVSIPKNTLAYYGSNGTPKINVLRNGVEYKDYTYDSSMLNYVFTETGTYCITFSGKYTENNKDIEINEIPHYFTIVSSNESKWAYEFAGYSNYYISSILKDDVDVTSAFTNVNIGNLITVDGNDYLSSILVCANDIITGNGKYTITINTNDEFEQSFTFSFKINDKIPPVNVSIKEGEKSYDPIYVSFNTSDLLENVGDCIIYFGDNDKNNITITAEDYAEELLEEFYNIAITRDAEYFIQVRTLSGRIMFNYNVTKQEPLSTFSIIVIVVIALALTAGVIIFVKLRKKVAIR